MTKNKDNPASVKVMLKELIDINRKIEGSSSYISTLSNILTDIETNGYNDSNRLALFEALPKKIISRDNPPILCSESTNIYQGMRIKNIDEDTAKGRLKKLYEGIENYTGINDKKVYINIVIEVRVLSGDINYYDFISGHNSEINIVKELLRSMPQSIPEKYHDLKIKQLTTVFLSNYFNDAKEFFLSTKLFNNVIHSSVEYIIDTGNSDFLDLAYQILISDSYTELELWKIGSSKISSLICHPDIFSKFLKEVTKNDNTLSTDIVDTIINYIKNKVCIFIDERKLVFDIIKTLVEAKGSSDLPIFNINSESFRTMLATRGDIMSQEFQAYLYEHGLDSLENHTKVPVIVTDNQSAHQDEVSDKAREQLTNLRGQFSTTQAIIDQYPSFEGNINWANAQPENPESLANLAYTQLLIYQIIINRTLSEINSYISDLITNKDLRKQTIAFSGDTVAVGVRTGEGFNTVTKLLDTGEALELVQQAFNHFSTNSTADLPFNEVFYLIWAQACKQEKDNHTPPYYYRSDLLKVLAQIGCEYYKNESGIESVML